MTETQINFDKKRLDKNFPYFAKPEIVGEYTVSHDRQITLGRSRAKNLFMGYERHREVNFNLNKGFETFQDKGNDTKLNVLFQWIRQFSPPGSRLRKVLYETEFVSWRGVLTRIAVSPYVTESWRFRAVWVLGVIFIEEIETEEKIASRENMGSREQMMTYWGFKFEQYMTTSDDEEQPNTLEPVSNFEEFGNVVRTQLGSDGQRPLQLLYSAEIDCLHEGKAVELKTHKGELDGWFWDTKSLKWWMQSFLVNIPKIVVGHRDAQGIVRKVGPVTTEKLAEKGKWGGAICMNFLSLVLTEVRRKLGANSPACIVDCKGGSNCFTISLVPLETCADIVPDSFVQNFSVKV